MSPITIAATGITSLSTTLHHSLSLCCSGEGGAIYAQSASLAVNSSRFENNYAVTGQLDNGASGGAIVVTHCYPVLLTRTTFTANGGAGYYGTFRS